MQPFWFSTTGSFGVLKVYSPRPSFTKITTLERLPLSSTTTSGGTTGFGCSFWQYGSALMLIGLACTGLPSKVTVPEMEPTVELSTTFVAFELATGFSFVSGLLPPPAKANITMADNARLKNLVFICNNSSLVERDNSNNSAPACGANSFQNQDGVMLLYLPPGAPLPPVIADDFVLLLAGAGDLPTKAACSWGV